MPYSVEAVNHYPHRLCKAKYQLLVVCYIESGTDMTICCCQTVRYRAKYIETARMHLRSFLFRQLTVKNLILTVGFFLRLVIGNLNGDSVFFRNHSLFEHMADDGIGDRVMSLDDVSKRFYVIGQIDVLGIYQTLK